MSRHVHTCATVTKTAAAAMDRASSPPWHFKLVLDVHDDVAHTMHETTLIDGVVSIDEPKLRP